MNYYPQTINFREVYRGDSQAVTLIIDDVFSLAEVAEVRMQVRPEGDFSDEPILTIDLSEGITISGQELTLSISPGNAAAGRYRHDIQFTTPSGVYTLYAGLFEIIQDQTIN